MPAVPGNEVFSIDWADLQQVITLARKFGPGMSVIQHPNRRTFNITHTEREKSLDPMIEVLFRTGKR